MKEAIINNLDNPRQLETLYRENKTAFKKAFNTIFEDIKAHKTAQIWYERLNFDQENISWGTSHELVFVIVASFIAYLIAKLPQFMGIDDEYFFQRNIAFVVFPVLTAYFAWKQKVPSKTIAIAAIAFLLSVFYINMLPNDPKSDTLILACIHLPLLLWAVLGFVFVGENLKNNAKRLDFLRYNGDLVVMTTIILIAGGLLSGITMGLFKLIGLHIEKFYGQYIVVWGLAAAPIVGTYLVQTNPHLVNKISPVIAKLFTPLVFVMLFIYLIAVIYTGKDPYTNREFLMVFNVLLLGVMALILFSIAETSKNVVSKLGIFLLLGLSVLTIIVNGIALSAIVFRISEWGISPNRLAILGSNILILTNLLIVTYRLFKTVKNSDEIEKVENSIASFLPIYIVWVSLVAFIFPLLFSFK
jgi:hypothetical protein